MTSSLAVAAAASPAPPDPEPAPVVDVVVPVFNEERDLDPSIRRLHAYLTLAFPYSFRITVADNASTDGTWHQAQELAEELPHVRAIRLEQKGRGRALRHVWSASDAAVLAYMDVDLSTDLAALLPLVAPLVSGHSDVAIGSRLARSARVVRGPKREVISRCYNLLLHTTLATRFSDAQCGFKAVRREAAVALLPLVEDQAWFFDTELLVLAERAGLRIHEVPVDWVDDPDSRVDLVRTAVEDLRGVARLVRGLATGRIPVGTAALREPRPVGTAAQVLRFGMIGVLSTVAYLLLYLVLRQGMSAEWANGVALLVTAIGNTAANSRWTFSVRGATGAARQQLQGLVVFGLALGLTTGALGLLHAAAATAGRLVEVLVLATANALATALRFVLLRGWVFRSATPPELQGISS
jgi:glycosyltransferase involved in cell wall biosynthesis